MLSKKTIPDAVKCQVDKLIRNSLEESFKQYPQLSAYITEHAQEMEVEVMRKHIELYVNDFSIDLGNVGRNAIQKLFAVYSKNKPGLIDQRLFVDAPR